MEGLYKVTIWGILPIYFAVTVFSSTLLVKSSKKASKPLIEEVCGKNKYYNTDNIYFTGDYISDIYLGTCAILGVIPYIILFNKKCESYIYEMIKKIDVVSSICIGLTSIAVMMAVVIILYDKRYYIFFSIQDVLQKYKFAECLLVVICSCVIVSVDTMTLLNDKLDTTFDWLRFLILEIATICNIAGSLHIFIVIIKIMFFEQKNELILLKKLYRTFWSHKIDKTHFKSKDGWSREAIEINLEYLVGKYIDICKRKKISQIDRIEFVTTLGCYKKKWYNKARKKFILIMLILCLVSNLINRVVLQEEGKLFILLNIIITMIIIIYSYWGPKNFQFVILRLFSDTWGYYIYQNNGKELLIPRVGKIKGNIVYKYIMQMNSLNAFFYIWINYMENEETNVEEQLYEVIKWIETLEEKNEIVFLPIFIIGFFLFEKGIKVDKIKEIYLDIVNDEDKKYSFERMLFSQIFYLTKQDISEYNQLINSYVGWVENKEMN